MTACHNAQCRKYCGIAIVLEEDIMIFILITRTVNIYRVCLSRQPVLAENVILCAMFVATAYLLDIPRVCVCVCIERT